MSKTFLTSRSPHGSLQALEEGEASTTQGEGTGEHLQTLKEAGPSFITQEAAPQPPELPPEITAQTGENHADTISSN